MMIASGDYQVVALRTDNTLWGWGANDHGVLGIGLPPGVFKSMRAPFEVGGKKKWVSVASGYHHMLALRDDLTLWSWGENLAGQLGNGTTTDALVPTAVGTTQVWKSIACGAYHSLAIRNDGTLWTWGLSDHGELGLGKYGFKKTPTQAGAADLWTQVQGGLAFSIMVRADGSLWSAGNNEFGQLGNTTVPFGFGDTNNSPKMVRIGQVTSW